MVAQGLMPLLTSQGHQPCRLLRRKENIPPADVGWLPDEGYVDRRKLEAMDAVIHLAGENIASRRWSPARKAALLQSRVRPTRFLAETLAGMQHPPKSLFCASALGFYGDRASEVLDESSDPGTGFLSEVCQAWEEATRPAVEAGIRVVHLRFGLVLSSQGGALKKMLPLFRCGLGGPLGRGRQYMSWIALEDAARAIAFLLDHPEGSGAFNFCTSAPVTNLEFSRALGRVLHRPAGLPAPRFALRLALGEMADPLLLASTRALPRRLSEAGFEFRFPNIEEALDHLIQFRV